MKAPAATHLTSAIIAVTLLCWGAANVMGLSDVVNVEGGFIAARFEPDFPVIGVVPALLTPLTATLLHSGIMHILFNMVTLYYCGRQVEAVLGPVALAILYLVGAYAAALAHYLSNPLQLAPMVGASGAISAVIGTYAMLFSNSETKAVGPIPAYWVRALWLAAAWVGVQWMIGFSGLGGGVTIAIWAHVGGFLAGILLARPLVKRRYAQG